jgi:L-alanine-DL-glutamate epimerase-like enolase superfamily enzyme
VKIKTIQFFKAVSPLSKPIADSTHTIPEIGFIVTRITTDTGIVGEAYLLAFHYSPNAILGALQDVRDMAIGWDANDTSGFKDHFERESEYFGNPGIQRWALGSVEIAMWDVKARSLGKPVWRMFDTFHDRVPLYGSGGWLSYSLDELLHEVNGYAARGFKAVKVKVGSWDLKRDVDRLHTVRETVGPEVNVMMDANQGMDLKSASALATAVKALNITWFEEPLPNTDFEGYKALHKGAGIKLAMGEREFDTTALRELVHRDAIDLWQPDILRLGGVQGWRDSAALALRHGIPVLPHYYKEYDVPLMMTVPNAYGCESFDWVDGLIDRPIVMKDGFAYPHDEPGWGFRFKDEHLTEVLT